MEGSEKELYSGIAWGWGLLQQVIVRAGEGKGLVTNPVAWVYADVKDRLEALRRNYGSGMAGMVLKGPVSGPLQA